MPNISRETFPIGKDLLRFLRQSPRRASLLLSSIQLESAELVIV